MNLPNLLTILRILLTPVFVICVMRDLHLFALVVFTTAGVTDGLDGMIARCFNQKTSLGEHLDPIADKLLLASAFITLAVLSHIPSWLAVIVITRDVLILLGIAVLYLMGVAVEIRPRITSKLTTVAQLVTIFLVLLRANVDGLENWIGTFQWITAGLTIFSGLHYTYLGLRSGQKDEEKARAG